MPIAVKVVGSLDVPGTLVREDQQGNSIASGQLLYKVFEGSIVPEEVHALRRRLLVVFGAQRFEICLPSIKAHTGMLAIPRFLCKPAGKAPQVVPRRAVSGPRIPRGPELGLGLRDSQRPGLVKPPPPVLNPTPPSATFALCLWGMEGL